MDIFQLMRQTNNYELIFYEEPSVSLRAIIAINNTVLGPVLASTKIFNFNNFEKATNAALTMAYYNTFRSALLKTQFGGGSIILCGDPKKVKNEFYLRALGIYINKFAGKIFIARGSDLTGEDIHYIWRETDYVLGADEIYLKHAISPAQATAKGMIYGLKAAVKEQLSKEDLSGLTFVVQGVDNIGYHIIEELLKFDNVNVIITDRIYDKIKEIQDRVPEVKVVKPSEIFKQKCDIFINSTFDNYLTPEQAAQLNTKILTSSVNNLIDDTETQKIIDQKNILYIPGYVINGGEILLFESEFYGYEPDSIEPKLYEIYNITLSLLKTAKEQNISVNQAAINTAKQYLENISAIKKLR